jgi:TRAP-type C4-dicarboxylate transport system permease small subunit
LSYSATTSIRTAARFLEERTSILFTVLGALSGVGLIAMMMITVLDAIGRRFFEFTIYGAYEGGSFLLSGVFFFSLC